MKRALLIILIISLVLMIGCEQTISNQDTIVDTECTTDNDCITTGCSGTICQSKDKEQIRTTCIYSPKYECYKEIGCRCLQNRCAWDKTKEFDECIEKNS